VTAGPGVLAVSGRAPSRGRAAGRPPILRCSARCSGTRSRLRGGRADRPADGGQQSRVWLRLPAWAAWPMAAQAACSPVCGGTLPVCGGTVSRPVRWPRAQVAVSSPAGMVANQPSRTTRRPRRAADLQPAWLAGIPPGHVDHDPGDGAGGSVPSVQGQDQPGQLRGRVGRPGHQPPSSSVRAQRSGRRRSRGLRAASGRSPSGW
jgi:hypothetical protein